jgi:hypothetical protein
LSDIEIRNPSTGRVAEGFREAVREVLREILRDELEVIEMQTAFAEGSATSEVAARLLRERGVEPKAQSADSAAIEGFLRRGKPRT